MELTTCPKCGLNYIRVNGKTGNGVTYTMYVCTHCRCGFGGIQERCVKCDGRYNDQVKLKNYTAQTEMATYIKIPHKPTFTDLTGYGKKYLV